MLIDPAAFQVTYRSSVADVMRFVTREKQLVIATHDQTLHPDRHNLLNYLEASEKRYSRVLELVNRHAKVGSAELTVLDTGGFLAAFPLALARLGIPTMIAEVYAYYHGAFDDLRSFLEGEGVGVWDLDLTHAQEGLPDRRFELVTNMAMIEHLPGSPKALMTNLRHLVRPGGKLILEVPNVGYWPKRWAALLGRSVHQPLDAVYESEPPFVGHHREYTEQELRDVLEWSGFLPDEITAFNYSIDFERGLVASLRQARIWPTIFRGCREVLMACASPVDRAGRR
jgi:SAM-dependent methyltransferase